MEDKQQIRTLTAVSQDQPTSGPSGVFRKAVPILGILIAAAVVWALTSWPILDSDSPVSTVPATEEGTAPAETVADGSRDLATIPARPLEGSAVDFLGVGWTVTAASPFSDILRTGEGPFPCESSELVPDVESVDLVMLSANDATLRVFRIPTVPPELGARLQRDAWGYCGSAYGSVHDDFSWYHTTPSGERVAGAVVLGRDAVYIVDIRWTCVQGTQCPLPSNVSASEIYTGLITVLYP